MRRRFVLRPSLGEILLNYGTLAAGIILNVAAIVIESVRRR